MITFYYIKTNLIAIGKAESKRPADRGIKSSAALPRTLIQEEGNRSKEKLIVFQQYEFKS